MSMQLVVFGRRPPSDASAWSRHAAEAGFSLEFSGRFNPLTHSGAVRVTCEGLEAAFEYYNDDIREYLDEAGADFSFLQRRKLRTFPRAINFVTHSRSDDWLAACVAAAICADLSEGQLLDTTTGRFMNPAEAKAWAAECVRKLLPKNAGQRGAIAANAHRVIELTLTGRGFAPIESLRLTPDRATSAGERWYHRSGEPLPNQFVQVETWFDGEEGFAGISFWASPHEVSVVREQGLIGNAAGLDLFMFLWGRLERDVATILPRAIPIVDLPAERLRAEIDEVDGLVWRALAEDWEELQREESEEM